MRMRLFQVFDKVAQAVMGPILVYPNEGPAVRAFYDGLSSPGTTLNSHPADYELLDIGAQDTSTGQFEPECTPTVITSGSIWLATQQQTRDASSSAASENGSPRLQRA